MGEILATAPLEPKMDKQFILAESKRTTVENGERSLAVHAVHRAALRSVTQRLR